MVWGLRKLSRALIAAIVVLGGLVVAATPASAAIGLTFTTSGLPSGVVVAGTVTTTNNGCNNPSAKSWTLTTPSASNSNTTGNGAGCAAAPYTQPATVNSAAGDRYTFQSGSPASPIPATGSSAIQVTLTYALTCTHISITSQPASVTKTLGDTATFSVTATGTSPQYQWRKGTTNISGATSASYTIPSVVAADAANNYNVVVSNSCGATPASVTSNNATLTYTKVTPSITWSNPAAVDYGTALSATQLNATASVPGSFVYTPAAGAVPGAGSQNLHAAFTPTDTATYDNASADVTLVVNPVGLVATANNTARAYGDANPTFSANYSGFVNGDDEGDLTTPPTCTTTATSGSLPGTYPITCASAVSSNYTISYVGGTLTITNGSLVVTGDNASRNYGDANPALSATVSGFGNGEDESVLTATPSCTTTADESSPAGTYPITCSGAAADNYDITYVAGTLTVLPAPLSVSVADASRDYGAANPAFAPVVTGFVNGEDEGALTALPVCSSSATATSNAGTYPITCSGGTAANYAFSYTAGTLTVDPIGLIATANDANRPYGGSASLSATITGFVNGDDEGDLTTLPTCTTTATAASPVGEYSITCSDAAAINYTFSYVAGTLTVDPALLTVTADDAARAYGAANPALTATITGFANDEDDTVLTTSPTCSTTADEASPAGEYPITCSGAAADNYTFSYVAGTLTVDPALLTVTAGDAGRAYGAANPAFGSTITGFVNGDDEGDLTTLPTCTSAAGATTPVGTAAITCSGAVADNYTFNYVDGTLTIDPVNLTVTANDASRAYGAANPAFGSTITGFVNDEDDSVLTTAPTCATPADESAPAGDYPITCSGAAADNYTFSYVDGTLTVGPLTLTVTADNATRAYGAANPAFTATITGFVNGDDEGDLTTLPTCTSAADATTPVGTAAITCSGAADDDYSFSYVDGTLTIDPVNLTVTANDASRAYGAANPAFGSTITGFVNDEDDSVLTTAPTCATTADEASPVGDYPITCSGAAADNYTFSYVDGTLTVGNVTLTVTADDASRAYGAANPAFTATITGFANGDDESVLTGLPVCTTGADESSPVGPYPITCSGAAADNYDISYAAGTLTVNSVDLTVTVDDATRAYGAANPVFVTAVAGFVNGEDDSVLTAGPVCVSAAASAPVGDYPISCSGAAAPNYTFSYVDGTLTVTPASLTVTADDASRAYGAANPPLTATITGFVNSEDESVLTTTPTCSTSADESSAVGGYAIACSGAAADNYEFTYSDGTLNVDPAELTVTAQGADRAYGAANPAFVAVVTGFVNGEDDDVLTAAPVCSSAADELSPAGSALITCTGATAPNYSVTYVDGTLTITPVTLTVTVDDATRAYGAANPVFVTAVTGFVNGEDDGVLTTAPVCVSAAATAAVGDYPISCTGAAADNYTFDYVDGTLTVTSAELTVTANNASRPAGSPNPAFTASVTGFANDETTAVLTTQPSCTSAANAASPAGTYPITCSGAAAANYTFTYVDGTLTVTPAAPTGPVIRVGDASVAEGSTTLKKNSLTFTVTVDKPVTAVTEVLWALSNGTATGGKTTPADFTAKTNGKLKINVGKKVGYVNAVVLPDTTIEPDETLTLTLLSANSGAVLGDATATGTILDDDTGAGVKLSIGDAQVWEGNTGALTAGGKLWVTLNNPAVSTVTVTVAVTGGTAISGKISPADFKEFKTKTLTFKPGQWKKAVVLQVLADTNVEADETVTVTLSAASPGVTITKAVGTLTVLNDD